MTKPWQGAPAADKGLEDDPLLEFLGDFADTTDFFVVVGLVRKVPGAARWRIYLDFALSEYYEVAEEDVVYATTTADDSTRVWIESGVPVRHVVQRPTRAERIWSSPGRAARRAAYGDGQYISGSIAEWGDGFGAPDEDGDPQGTGCRCSLQRTNR